MLLFLLKTLWLSGRIGPTKSILLSYCPLNVSQMVSAVCSGWPHIPSTLNSLCCTHIPPNSCFLARFSNAPRPSPPRGLELTKVAFYLNTLSLSGVKNKACQSLTACREKDINYSRQRVERSCREWEVLLLSCHLLRATGGALLRLARRAEVGPSTCEMAGQEEPAQGFRCWHWHTHQQQHPCLQTEPLWGSAQEQGRKAEERAAEAAAGEEIVQGPKIRSIAKYLCTWDFSYRDKVCH